MANINYTPQWHTKGSQRGGATHSMGSRALPPCFHCLPPKRVLRAREVAPRLPGLQKASYGLLEAGKAASSLSGPMTPPGKAVEWALGLWDLQVEDGTPGGVLSGATVARNITDLSQCTARLFRCDLLWEKVITRVNPPAL